MLSRSLKHVLGVGLLLIGGWTANFAPNAWRRKRARARRKAKLRQRYPDLARRMKITGVVKVQVTVAHRRNRQRRQTDGRTSGLANAVMDAVGSGVSKRGRETKENLEFHFNPKE